MSRSLNDLTPAEAAAELGLDVQRPQPDELFVDLDVFKQGDWDTRIASLTAVFPGTRVLSIEPSQTEGHKHAIVSVGRTVSAHERIALELFLGSDPWRGLLGLRDIEQGRPDDASVFFFAPLSAAQVDA